jgi:glycerate-2-kinase
VLGALPFLARNELIASVASDGKDFIKEAAGALADEEIAARARALKLDPNACLDRNDSYRFFSRAGGLIVTGSTGTNVSDLMIAMRY